MSADTEITGEGMSSIFSADEADFWSDTDQEETMPPLEQVEFRGTRDVNPNYEAHIPAHHIEDPTKAADAVLARFISLLQLVNPASERDPENKTFIALKELCLNLFDNFNTEIDVDASAEVVFIQMESRNSMGLAAIHSAKDEITRLRAANISEKTACVLRQADSLLSDCVVILTPQGNG